MSEPPKTFLSFPIVYTDEVLPDPKLNADRRSPIHHLLPQAH
jgi:hypothetical protein